MRKSKPQEIILPVSVKNEIKKDLVDNCIPLSTAEKETIAELMIIRTLKKGTLILREGQISTNCYTILEGGRADHLCTKRQY